MERTEKNQKTHKDKMSIYPIFFKEVTLYSKDVKNFLRVCKLNDITIETQHVLLRVCDSDSNIHN